MTLQIWIDEQIADREAFARLGDVHSFSGRSIDSQQLSTADVLIVRSVTRVDAALLDGTPIRFVGTATTGVDHIDIEYLQDAGIAFATAAGFNARPVAEYVLACIFLMATDRNLTPASMTLGVVGAGRIGSCIGRWAEAIGLRVMYSDPPLALEGHPGPWTSIETLVADSDIISLHVPLTQEGSHATLGLVDADWLSRMKADAALINTSRGGIVDECALKSALSGRGGPRAIVDTWANEPGIDRELLSLSRIATPHIAGHTVEARHRGSRMVREALAAWRLASTDGAQPATAIGDTDRGVDVAIGAFEGFVSRSRQGSARRRDHSRISSLVVQTCGLEAMDGVFRAAMAERGAGFDAARRELGARREYSDRLDACI